VSRSSVVPSVVPAMSAATPAEEPERIILMADSELAVEVDAQLMQLTLRASHPQALPTDVARLKDVVDIFGEVSMQACLTEQSTWRSCSTRLRPLGLQALLLLRRPGSPGPDGSKGTGVRGLLAEFSAGFAATGHLMREGFAISACR
jgi:hypothetical protein